MCKRGGESERETERQIEVKKVETKREKITDKNKREKAQRVKDAERIRGYANHFDSFNDRIQRMECTADHSTKIIDI